jgi:hypothetical protein
MDPTPSTGGEAASSAGDTTPTIDDEPADAGNGDKSFSQYVNDLATVGSLKELAKVRDSLVNDPSLTDEHRINLRQHFANARERLGSPVKGTAKAEPPKAEPVATTTGVADGKITDTLTFFEWIKTQLEPMKGKPTKDNDMATLWNEKVEPLIASIGKEHFFYKACVELFNLHSQ